MTNQPGRVAVIGDLGGHAQVLAEELRSLEVQLELASATKYEANPDASWPSGKDWKHVAFEWPSDLHIVQVGDLVHRGPDSLGVVVLVDRLIEAGVWSQVVGNHEQLYVDRPIFDWDETLDDLAQSILRDWWADGRMVPAVAITDENDEWLVTHAGLTEGFWRHGLGGPTSAKAALGPLEEARSDGALWHPGTMLTGADDRNAGPVWAAAGTEVYPSWLAAGTNMPFNQIHGHSNALQWDRGLWWAEDWVRRKVTLEPEKRHATLTVSERKIVGIDPCHLAEAAPCHAPLIVPDAKVWVR